jgi:hypothetical protein
LAASLQVSAGVIAWYPSGIAFTACAIVPP